MNSELRSAVYKSVCLEINILSVDHPKTGRNIENKEIM